MASATTFSPVATATTFLNATTVQNDNVKDAIVGGTNDDFFVLSTLDTFDLKPGEQQLLL